jgi:transposase
MLNELLNLPGYFVKDCNIVDNKIYITVESEFLPVCPSCQQSFIGTVKDMRNQTVEDLSISGRRCFITVNKYRINCSCGYKGTEEISWLNPYSRVTNRFSNWIYAFCKRMTCIDVSRIFGISKHMVYRLDKEGITKELEAQDPIEPEKLGVDEISRKKGHVYATIVTAPNERKVVEVLKGRKKEALEGFYQQKGKEWCDNIKLVCMDAWLGFRTPTREYCKKAKIAFDHFHLAQHFGKAIDKLRVAEAKKASAEDKDVYKGSRWLLLKKPEKLKKNQKESLEQLLSLNKNLYIAYILREDFRQIFAGPTSHCRLIRLTRWIQNARSADIPQINEFVDNIEKWKPYIRNSLRDNVSNSFAEGINAKVRVVQRMAYGYKDFEYLRLKIIQQFNFRDVKSIFET